MVYTHGVTLWMFVLRRLGGGKSLSKVVAQILAHDRDFFPDNKRVRENTLSENSGAYSQARKRLPLKTLMELSRRVCDYLSEISVALFGGRRVFLLARRSRWRPKATKFEKAQPKNRQPDVVQKAVRSAERVAHRRAGLRSPVVRAAAPKDTLLAARRTGRINGFRLGIIVRVEPIPAPLSHRLRQVSRREALLIGVGFCPAAY